MEILITICARGGSKGIPKKNIRIINNKPLIAYSIKHAFEFSKHFKSDIALSTDSFEIKNVAYQCGIATDYIRPDSISKDTTGKVETINHLLNFEETSRSKVYDYILDLDVSSPLRNVSDLLNAFNIIKDSPEALNLFSVNDANRNPYFNMVEKNNMGYFELVKKGDFTSRQTAPKVYELNASFYFYRRAFFLENPIKTICEKSLIFKMPHVCFDLDHPIDFDYMEFLITNNKLGFSI